MRGVLFIFIKQVEARPIKDHTVKLFWPDTPEDWISCYMKTKNTEYYI